MFITLKNWLLYKFQTVTFFSQQWLDQTQNNLFAPINAKRQIESFKWKIEFNEYYQEKEKSKILNEYLSFFLNVRVCVRVFVWCDVCVCVCVILTEYWLGILWMAI